MGYATRLARLVNAVPPYQNMLGPFPEEKAERIVWMKRSSSRSKPRALNLTLLKASSEVLETHNKKYKTDRIFDNSGHLGGEMGVNQSAWLWCGLETLDFGHIYTHMPSRLFPPCYNARILTRALSALYVPSRTRTSSRSPECHMSISPEKHTRY